MNLTNARQQRKATNDSGSQLLTFREACLEIWGDCSPARWVTLYGWSIAGACYGRIDPLSVRVDLRRRQEQQYRVDRAALQLFLNRVRAAFCWLEFKGLADVATFEGQLGRAKRN